MPVVMRQRTRSLPSPSVRVADENGNGGMRVALYDPPVYLHTSTLNSQNLTLSVRSPSVMHVIDRKVAKSVPVFSGRDSIGGTVTTTVPSIISRDHQLLISLEGAFYWIGPQREEIQPFLDTVLPERIKHVFLASTIQICLSPSDDTVTVALSDPGHNDNIQMGIRKRTFFRHRHYKRRAASEVDHVIPLSPATPRRDDAGISSHSFSFPLPVINSVEVPNTFAMSHVCQGNVRGRWYAEGAEIAYKLQVQVRPMDNKNDADTTIVEEQLEAEIKIKSDAEEKAPDPPPPNSWTHSQLASVGPVESVNFTSILSLPRPAEYARTAIIPVYLFIRASPSMRQSVPKLLKEARIRISLIRVVHLDSGLAVQAPAPRMRLPENTKDNKKPGPRMRLPENTNNNKKLMIEPKPRKKEDSLLQRISTKIPKIFKWNKRWSSRDDDASASKSSRHPAVTGTGSSTITASELPLNEKPLPDLPAETEKTYEDTIYSLMVEGFPKRVTRKSKRASRLKPETIANSDGVFKGELRLDNVLLNTIDWPDVAVTYFVEANVYYEEDVVRTREMIRLMEPYRNRRP